MGRTDWFSISIPIEGIDNDILIAWLDHSGVDVIREYDDYFDVFVPENKVQNVLSILLEKFELTNDKLKIIKQEDKNWNEEWESNFSPVIVDDIMIRAEFHPPPSEAMIDILIQPRMAFGTGHHESTFQMLQKINTMVLRNKNILDYGCGSGILGVLVLKKEMGFLNALDIQEEAIENTRENFKLNNLDPNKYALILGDLDLFSEKKFDLILANINRHILETNAELLISILKPIGELLISGILASDYNIIKDIYSEFGLSLVDQSRKGEWLCLQFKNS